MFRWELERIKFLALKVSSSVGDIGNETLPRNGQQLSASPDYMTVIKCVEYFFYSLKAISKQSSDSQKCVSLATLTPWAESSEFVLSHGISTMPCPLDFLNVAFRPAPAVKCMRT
jgi:hypothetical protein